MASGPSRTRSRRRTINEINMVPFIDVMLVLLIIFMVTAPLITTSVIDVPSVGKASSAPDGIIRIELKADHHIVISSSTKGGEVSEDVDASELANKTLALQAGSDAVPVIIFGDKSLPYEEVIKVLDGLQRQGVKRVGLSVQVNKM
jgi:biopolymer transport protein TolR